MIESLGNVLAPRISIIDICSHHWNHVLEFHSKVPIPIQETSIKTHVNKILKYALSEKDAQTFLIQFNVLPHLLRMAEKDTPIGIRPFAYNVATFLIQNIPNILSQIEESCVQFIELSLEKYSANEEEQMKYLETLMEHLTYNKHCLALFHYIDSPNFELSYRAMMALSKSKNISEISHLIVERASHLYTSLSKLSNYTSEVHVSWKELKDFKRFEEKWEYIAFYSWLDFMNDLIRKNTGGSQDLINSFRSLFLNITFQNDFRTLSDEISLCQFVRHLRNFWNHITFSDWVDSFSEWLFADTINTKCLLDPLNNSSNLELKSEILRFLENILDRPNKICYHYLFIHQFESQMNYSGQIQRDTMAPSNVHRLISTWLFLVNEVFPSLLPTGYDAYVQNANTQFHNIYEACRSFGWPTHTQSLIETDLHEGQFISSIFYLLENMLTTNVFLTVQVTTIISKLCLIPHPCLHDYLLNSKFSSSPKTRTLYSILKSVIQSAGKEETNGFSLSLEKIKERQKSLFREMRNSSFCSKDSILDGMVILSEFVKELAALCFVKYNYIKNL